MGKESNTVTIGMSMKKGNEPAEWKIQETASINIFINALLPSFMTYKIKDDYKTLNISGIKVEESSKQIIVYIDKK